MSSKTNSYAGTGFAKARGTNSASDTKAIIIPGLPGVQAFIRDAKATGGSSGALLHGFAARSARKTTVKTAAADAATTLVLNGDDAGLINGYTPTTSDYVLVAGNATSADDAFGTGIGWRILKIGGVTVSAASDQVSLTSLVGQDGHTGMEGTVSAGAVAYVISATDLVTLPVGAASVVYEDIVVGEVGAPVGVLLVPGGATAHYFSIAGTFE
jgi:hypothetical protein